MTSCYLCESHQDNPAKTTNRFPGGSTSLTLHCIQSYLNISFAWFYFLIPLFYSWVFALPANRNCFLFGIDCVRSCPELEVVLLSFRPYGPHKNTHTLIPGMTSDRNSCSNSILATDVHFLLSVYISFCSYLSFPASYVKTDQRRSNLAVIVYQFFHPSFTRI